MTSTVTPTNFSIAVSSAARRAGPVPTPVDTPDLWDSIILAGIKSPGIAEVTGGDREFGWEAKKSQGSDGATTTQGGAGLAKPKVKFLLWKEPGKVDHFEAWNMVFLPLLHSSQKAVAAKKTTTTQVVAHAGKPPHALDIYHPDLAANGIRSVVVDNIGQLVDEGKGLSSCAVSFLEFRPPKPAGGTPGGSKKPWANMNPTEKRKSFAEDKADFEQKKKEEEKQAAEYLNNQLPDFFKKS